LGQFAFEFFGGNDKAGMPRVVDDEHFSLFGRCCGFRRSLHYARREGAGGEENDGEKKEGSHRGTT
jgi:hypothetical protein